MTDYVDGSDYELDENLEVIEPEEEGGSDYELDENLDYTDPEGEVVGKKKANRINAEMRRKLADYEAQLNDYRLKEEKENARKRVMRSTFGSEQADLQSIAEATGLTVEDIQAEIDAEAEKTSKMKQLEAENNQFRMERQLQEDLAKIQKIDSNIESIEDLGPDFVALMASTDLTPEQAYYAVKMKEEQTTPQPPKEMGRVNQSGNEPTPSTLSPDAFSSLTSEKLDDPRVLEAAKRALFKKG